MALPKNMRLKGHRTFSYIHNNSKKYHGELMTFKVSIADPDILLSHKLKNNSNKTRKNTNFLATNLYLFIVSTIYSDKCFPTTVTDLLFFDQHSSLEHTLNGLSLPYVTIFIRPDSIPFARK